MTRRFLADASTLIALSACGRLGILHKSLKAVYTTAAVLDEVLLDRPGAEALQAALDDGWLHRIPAKGSIEGLGPGEASLLFAAKPEDILILDDRAARLEAKARGLRVVGVLGILVNGCQSGRLKQNDAVATLEALARGDFRMSAELYRWALDKLSTPA